MTNQNKLSIRPIIVYPEESGTLLAPAFRAMGINPIGIFSATGNTDHINHQDYDRIIVDKGDYNSLITQLPPDPLFCVLPGSERGVMRADQLNASLQLPANNYQLSMARRNKILMAREAERAGLLVPIQTAVQSLHELSQLITAKTNWPVILKPASSMGSEGVSLCKNADELTHEFMRGVNTTNRLGEKNQEFVVQQYLQGTEYAIDTISYAGTHKITAMWQYRKSGRDIIGIVPFTSKHLIAAQGTVQTSLMNYTYRLLDSLGVAYGPAHTELVLEDNHIQLMEIGARLHGGIAAMQMSKLGTGHSQVDICVNAFTNPVQFVENSPTPYTLLTHCCIALLIPPQKELYFNESIYDVIKNLPSVRSIKMNNTATQPLGDIAGLIQLSHTNHHQLESDLETIRMLEKKGLYITKKKASITQQ